MSGLSMAAEISRPNSNGFFCIWIFKKYVYATKVNTQDKLWQKLLDGYNN